jgi:hypothetical protein
MISRVRKCAVCGKTGGSATGFSTLLRELGFPNWRDDKAHLQCVRKLRAAKRENAEKENE